MKKQISQERFRIQILKPEEMLLIRAGKKKPEDPKTPDEGVMML
jgi:hypothetical protein